MHDTLDTFDTFDIHDTFGSCLHVYAVTCVSGLQQPCTSKMLSSLPSNSLMKDS